MQDRPGLWNTIGGQFFSPASPLLHQPGTAGVNGECLIGPQHAVRVTEWGAAPIDSSSKVFCSIELMWHAVMVTV